MLVGWGLLPPFLPVNHQPKLWYAQFKGVYIQNIAGWDLHESKRSDYGLLWRIWLWKTCDVAIDLQGAVERIGMNQAGFISTFAPKLALSILLILNAGIVWEELNLSRRTYPTRYNYKAFWFSCKKVVHAAFHTSTAVGNVGINGRIGQTSTSHLFQSQCREDDCASWCESKILKTSVSALAVEEFCADFARRKEAALSEHTLVQTKKCTCTYCLKSAHLDA